jgi:hypothetical protein
MDHEKTFRRHVFYNPETKPIPSKRFWETHDEETFFAYTHDVETFLLRVLVGKQ